MNLVVYTAWIGMTVPLPSPAPDATARYVAFVDDRGPVEPGWEVRRVPADYDDATRTARRIKARPDRWFTDADATIWLDGDARLLMPAVNIVRLRPELIVGFKHHHRPTLIDEARAVVLSDRAPARAVIEQMERYRRDGLDPRRSRPVTTTGLLVRRADPLVNRFNQLWEEELNHATCRDQLSVDFCAYAAAVTIGYFNGRYSRNGLVRFKDKPWATILR